MIVDLLYPSGRSVNDGIASDLCSLKYSSVDDALQFITMLGQNTLLIKVDLRSVYCMVPVHSTDCLPFDIHQDRKILCQSGIAVWPPLCPKVVYSSDRCLLVSIGLNRYPVPHLLLEQFPLLCTPI